MRKKNTLKPNRKLYRYGTYERSGSDYWMTPPDLLRKLNLRYGGLFDPCPRNPSFNGLEIDWPLDKICFVNPPYSNLADWTKKCQVEWRRGAKIILLMPARTDTKYFHNYVNGCCQIEFIKGRLKFVNPISGEAGKSAPFPSILCYYWHPEFLEVGVDA
tara:strand:+ start:1155 stop:1631 length:477 start_codon:yes stop_codon:yes gene_type:complete